MIIYVNYTDGSKGIIKCNAYEDVGRDIKVVTYFGCKYIEKYHYDYGNGQYHPGIESYQCDSQHAVFIKQPEVKDESN